MKKAPAPIAPGKLVANVGPSKVTMGALPEHTKRHEIPARRELKPLEKARVNTGPSRPNQGNIQDTTNSHFLPARREIKPSNDLQITPQSAADRFSPDPVGSSPKKWTKKNYSLTVPTTI
jgi:hypothetical protein